MIKFIALFLLALSSFNSFSDTLPQNSLERKQLQAMGYEFQKEDVSDEYTVANADGAKLAFTINKDRLAVVRFFIRTRKLSANEEFELMKIINGFNDKYPYQFSLNKGYMTATLYHFGSYEPKAFAKIVRLMEQANTVFESQPEIYELLNK